MRLHPHTYRHNIKIEHENRHPKMTVQKSTHFTPSLTKPKNVSQRKGERKDSANTKEGGGRSERRSW